MLRKTLKPEFLNRVDETIIFKPLSKADVREIVKMHFRNLQAQLREQDIRLTASEVVLNYLANEGYDPQFGARQVKRIMKKNVLNELSRQLLSGKVQRGQNIVLDIFDDQFVFRKPIDEKEVAEEEKEA